MISFADSSAKAWSGNLTITQPEGSSGRVRFGTSSGALTAAQLKMITLNGKSVMLNSRGYLRVGGFAFIIR